MRKPYSIASAPVETARNGFIELLVQVDDSGGPDPHLELATHGTPLDIEGPFGTFALPPLGHGARVLLVGGRHRHRAAALDADAGPRHRHGPPVAHVIYSARTVDELAYRDELEDAGAGRAHRL